jgi:2,3-dihydroxybenzoate-AMP ligase
MTADYIAFHAAERPDAVAFIDDGREITYSQFASDIRKFIGALRELGLVRGNRAGVGRCEVYLSWVLLLALEQLGVTAVMLMENEAPDILPLIASLDLVISKRRFPEDTVKKQHALTPQWVQHVMGLPDHGDDALPPKAPDDPVLVLYTTGTTADRKLLSFTLRTQSARINNWMWRLGLTRTSRYLLNFFFNVHAAYTLASAVIRSGGTVISETRTDMAPTLTAHAITHVMLFPIHLSITLDTLPAGFVKPKDLMIVTFGATLPEAVRERAEALLAIAIEDNYGSREVGFVSRILASGRGGVGTVSPGAEVEVIGEDGRPLPPGRAGTLRIKTQYMLQEYLDNPDATDRVFRDGWFYPGDVAILHGPRQLELVGRGDELMNIGGLKLAPGFIEGLLVRHAIAGDVGVCSLRNASGIEELCVALSDVQGSDQYLAAQIARALSAAGPLGRICVARLGRIPRNESGKIQRNRLRDAVARTIRAG